MTQKCIAQFEVEGKQYVNPGLFSNRYWLRKYYGKIIIDWLNYI